MVMEKPKPMAHPQLSDRVRLIRAVLGLLCLLSMAAAVVSLALLVILADARAGFGFGISGFVLWLAIRLGGKFRPAKPRGNWGTLVQTAGPD
jgi:hypothetical protein